MSANKFSRPASDGITYNPVQMAIYVPSTDFSKQIPPARYKARIADAVKFLNNTFGGSTRERGTGSWEDNGKTISEEVTIVETFASVKDYNTAKEKLIKWLKAKKASWKQYVLSFEFENDLGFVGGGK